MSVFDTNREPVIADDAFASALSDALKDRLRDITRGDFSHAVWIGGGDAGVLKTIKSIDTLAVRLRPTDGVIEHFPYPAQSLDLVVANSQLQTVNDLPGALVQIRRALKPDGLFICAIAGGETLYELRDCVMQAEARKQKGAAARIHPMIDLQTFAVLMQRAGFALPVVDAEKKIIHYKSLKNLLRDIKKSGEGLALAHKPPYAGKDFWNDVESDYRARYADKDGLLRATIEIIYAIGWAPSDTQQQPLKPGSAKARLADALGSDEVALPDRARPHLN